MTAAIAKRAREVAATRAKGKKAEKALTMPEGVSRNNTVHALMREHLGLECKRVGLGFSFSLRCSSHPDSAFHMHLASLEDHLQTPVGHVVSGFSVKPALRKMMALQADDDFESVFEKRCGQ